MPTWLKDKLHSAYLTFLRFRQAYSGIAIVLLVAAYLTLSTTCPKHSINLECVEHNFHLVLLVTLVIVELYMIYQMRKEDEERRKSLQAFQAFRAAMGRDDYMRQIELAIRNARQEVIFTSASMEASWRSASQAAVLKAVLERQKQDYSHRGVVAMRPSALPGAIELMAKTKVQLRMSPVLCMTRLRFVVADREHSVIGVVLGDPELGHQETSTIADIPTQASFVVDSSMLGISLHERFNILFDKGLDPMKYLGTFIAEAASSREDYSHTGVRDWLGADKSDISDVWLCDQSPAYAEMFFRSLKTQCGDREPTKDDCQKIIRGRFPKADDAGIHSLVDNYKAWDTARLNPNGP